MITRFKKYLSEPTETGCILWTGCTDANGYGILRSKGKTPIATRLAWEFANGEIPSGLFVLHNCPGGDNPRCVNPAHLFLGTQADNMADKTKKGRQNKGETSHFSKLTVEQVLRIRAEFAAGGINKTQLARKFNITRRAVGFIIARETWKHV